MPVLLGEKDVRAVLSMDDLIAAMETALDQYSGGEQHPLYAALTGKDSPFPGEIKWNFGKFLVDRNGRILRRFEPQTKPDAPEVIEAVEAAVVGK